jgi:carbon-monoxide dehydrogenase medium subunit
LQTPAKFEYTRATSVEDALATLQRLGGGARVVAGGHSLLPMMKLRLANPDHLVDINDLEPELNYIRVQGDEIRIGAMTRHVDLLKSDLLARHFPLFQDAEEVIADPVVRNRGTIGGSLCQADAAEDLSAVCSAAKATVVIQGADGERVVDMGDFHVGPYMTAVGDGELLTEVRLPLRSGAGSAHEKVERRAGDWAICASAACVWIDRGEIADVGIALSAVGLTTVDVTSAEELLRGQAPSASLFEEAGRIAAADCSPSSDGRGPVEYKRHLANVLTVRALTRATERAQAAPSRPYASALRPYASVQEPPPAPAPTPAPSPAPPAPEPAAAAPAAPAEPPPAAPTPEPAAAEPPAPTPPAPEPPASDSPPRISWRRSEQRAPEPAAAEPAAPAEPPPAPPEPPAPEPAAAAPPQPPPAPPEPPAPEPAAAAPAAPPEPPPAPPAPEPAPPAPEPSAAEPSAPEPSAPAPPAPQPPAHQPPDWDGPNIPWRR